VSLARELSDSQPPGRGPDTGPRERDHWGDLGVDGWITLGWISRIWDMGI